MKNRLIIVSLVTFSAMMWMIAATLTVDIPGSPNDPNSDVSRVSRAYGELYQLGHPASMQEVSFQTQMWIVSRTKAYENDKYNRNYVEVPLVMQPTPVPTSTPQPSPSPTALGKIGKWPSPLPTAMKTIRK